MNEAQEVTTLATPNLSRPRALLGSMRVRILAAVLILMAASAIASDIVLRESLNDRLLEEIASELRAETEEFELLASGLDPRTGRPFGSDVEAIFEIYFAREVADEGETLLAFVDGGLYYAESAEGAVPVERMQEAIDHWLSLPERTEGNLMTALGPARYVALPFDVGGRQGLFVAANFPGEQQAKIDDAMFRQAVTQMVMIVIASFVGLALAGRVLRPLRLLADTAQTITATDLTRRIPVRGNDEASRIARTFNDMLERLEAVVAAQREFLDDASHELRVPLTVVRGNVEVLELETDPQERALMIQTATDEIDRMNRIVEDLLLLARSERPDFLSLQAVDLGELTREIHRKATVLCRRDWLLEESAEGVVQADGQRLTQAVMQFAQNACQHTADEAPIRLGSRMENEEVVLWVHDSGKGVDPVDAERLFGRYVRVGRPPGSGLGLGLSIVAAIAAAHGGRARVAPTTAGARFEVIIPLVRIARTRVPALRSRVAG
jgi:two-component system, OmpR family, sensor kinase